MNPNKHEATAPKRAEEELTEDELIASALQALDSPLSDTTHHPFQEEVSPASPTLAELDASRRPKAKTVCEDCPNSVWFTSPAEVKCYCRVMFLLTWSSHAPNQITGCDGMHLGQEP